MGKFIRWIYENGLDTLVIICIGVVVWLIYRYYTTPRPITTSLEHISSCTSCKRKVTPSIPEQDFLSNIPIQLKVPSTGSYRVIEYPNFISDELCEQLKYSALPELKTSAVYNAFKIGNTSTNDQTRISKGSTLRNIYSDQVAEYVANWTKIPREYQEYVQVIKYDEQGVFDFHYDTVPANRSLPSWSRMITVMIYLNGGPNDPEETPLLGGETEFPAIDKTIRPEKGKAVLFWSVRPNEKGGELIKESLHKGSIVKSGEKWICNVWIHSQPFIVDARYQ